MDAVDALLECHTRIRRFMAGLGRMIALEGPWDHQLPPAAQVLARYLHEGLPLHAADEEEFLRPCLLAQGVSTEVTQALHTMEREHREMDTRLPGFLAQLAALQAREPIPWAAFQADGAWIKSALLKHIDQEEAVIFPIARQLPPPIHRQIREEMRLRRQQATLYKAS